VGNEAFVGKAPARRQPKRANSGAVSRELSAESSSDGVRHDDCCGVVLGVMLASSGDGSDVGAGAFGVFFQSAPSGASWGRSSLMLSSADVDGQLRLGFAFELLLDGLLGRDRYILMFDVQAQAVECAHVEIGDPDQREPGDEVAAPACVEQVEAGEDEEEYGYIMREAVFAGEEVEEFSCYEGLAVLGEFLA